jgi:O-acetyl-ADP-ribose deacetylase (regulator of RNase III)
MITYLKGDATELTGDSSTRKKIIVHVCNDLGGWGRGFVLALSKKWPQPEAAYRRISKNERILGIIQPVRVDKKIVVVNMIAQSGYGLHNIAPIRYDALTTCLQQVNAFARHYDTTIHMPKIGSGLAGGDWNQIEAIINKTLENHDVYVYELN